MQHAIYFPKLLEGIPTEIKVCQKEIEFRISNHKIGKISYKFLGFVREKYNRILLGGVTSRVPLLRSICLCHILTQIVDRFPWLSCYFYGRPLGFDWVFDSYHS